MRASFEATPKPKLSTTFDRINAFSNDRWNSCSINDTIEPQRLIFQRPLDIVVVRVLPTPPHWQACMFTSTIATRDAPPRSASCTSSKTHCPAPTNEKGITGPGVKDCACMYAQKLVLSARLRANDHGIRQQIGYAMGTATYWQWHRSLWTPSGRS